MGMCRSSSPELTALASFDRAMMRRVSRSVYQNSRIRKHRPAPTIEMIFTTCRCRSWLESSMAI